MMSIKRAVAVCAVMMVALMSWGAEAKDMTLPAPHTQGGKPLMTALKDRETSRNFGQKPLSPQVLSDLLWAAAGINRPESGKRTIPSAKNWQIVEVYAVLENGAFAYDAKANTLKVVAQGDLRKLTGMQEFVSSAPLNLVYVADMSKMKGGSSEEQATYAGAEAGFMIQNVYLFCASEGLATVVRGSVNRKPLAEALKLPEQKKIVLVQTVGYPTTQGK